MNVRGRAVAVRIAAIVAGSITGFVLFQAPIRMHETRLVDWLVGLLPGEHTYVGSDPSILVIPNHGAAFRAIITPSCSALASVLALTCLSVLVLRLSWRMVLSLAAAVAMVVVGNLLRIAGSVAAGIVSGRSTLILFHDWIGGLMTFAFTLGGYVVLLFLMLPAHDGRSELSEVRRAG